MPNGKCQHCGEELVLRPEGTIPTHDFPKPCRSVCPGSGQLPAIPTPAEQGDGKITAVEIPEYIKKSTINCTIRGLKGVPLKATHFANLIIAQVGLLTSVQKNTKDAKGKLVWCITEAAIIGEDGSFSVTGYPKSAYDKVLAEAKAANESAS